MTRYLLLSAASGVLWAGVAWLLAASQMPGIVWGGLVASPVIGVAVGAAYLPAYGRARWVRALAALGTLYLAVLLFGVGVGVADVLRDLPGRRSGELVYQGVLGALWGVTFTGYVAFLWPLAVANHGVLGRFAPGAANARRAGA